FLVLELVVVAQKLTQDSLVPLTLETRYRSRLAAHTRRRLPRLRTARVEGRVEVGEGERGIREPARDLEVVALDQQAGCAELDHLNRHPWRRPASSSSTLITTGPSASKMFLTPSPGIGAGAGRTASRARSCAASCRDGAKISSPSDISPADPPPLRPVPRKSINPSHCINHRNPATPTAIASHQYQSTRASLLTGAPKPGHGMSAMRSA